jgi:hypothetical protein
LDGLIEDLDLDAVKRSQVAIEDDALAATGTANAISPTSVTLNGTVIRALLAEVDAVAWREFFARSGIIAENSSNPCIADKNNPTIRMELLAIVLALQTRPQSQPVTAG